MVYFYSVHTLKEISRLYFFGNCRQLEIAEKKYHLVQKLLNISEMNLICNWVKSDKRGLIGERKLSGIIWK